MNYELKAALVLGFIQLPNVIPDLSEPDIFKAAVADIFGSCQRSHPHARLLSSKEDWLRERYVKGMLRLSRIKPSKEEIRGMLREYALSMGVPEDEIGEYIRSATTMIQAGLKIEDLIYFKA